MNWRKVLYHVGAVVFFAALSLFYFFPLVEGKKMVQHDIVQSLYMQGEIKKFSREEGRHITWTNSMFGGMPAFQIRSQHPKNLFTYIVLGVGEILVDESHLLFLLLLGMYIAVLALTGDILIAIVAAVAFAFGSFNLISIDAGHMTKVRAIAMIAPIIAGIVVAFRGNILTGAAMVAFFLGLQVRFNHLQISYYTMICAGVVGLVLLIRGFMGQRSKDKGQGKMPESETRNQKPETKSASLSPSERQKGQRFRESSTPQLATLLASGALVLAVILAIASNTSQLLTTQEYAKETIRGEKSELSSKQNEAAESGLDKDYAFSWSYGVKETFTLIIPYFMGGASAEPLDENSNLAKKGVPKKFLSQIPTYWGDQPFTAGPTYFGIITVFLFLLGMIFYTGTLRWVLFGLIIFTMFLSWGRNFMSFNELMFEFFPFYNKFRTPSMILSVTNTLMVLIGALGLWELNNLRQLNKENMRKLYYAAGSLGALLLIMGTVGSSLFDFSAEIDQQLQQNGWPVDALRKDRAAMMTGDAWRALLFLALAAGVVWAWLSDKLKFIYALPLLGALILIDEWAIDRRYLNNDDFVSKSKYESYFAPSAADRQILQDESYYRVLDLRRGNPFTSANSALFHKSVGGYHAAKLRRYQELIETRISENINNLSKGFGNENIPVLNMLNTKYLIGKEDQVFPNPGAMGPAWFVSEYEIVKNADEELDAMKNFDPAKTAIVDQRFSDYLQGFSPANPTAATLTLQQYDPEHLIYKTNSSQEALAVFSEIYYNEEKGWQAYIDGQTAKHIRVNYVLRAMRIPAGEHTVEFKFEPSTYRLGENISLAFSSITLLFVLLVAGWKVRENLRQD